MVLWFFSKVAWFVLAAMLEGMLLPSNMAAKNYFLLISCSTFHIYAQMCIFGTNCLISMASSLTSSLSILNIWWHGGLTAMLLWRNKTIYISFSLRTAEAFPVIASLPPKIASAHPSGKTISMTTKTFCFDVGQSDQRIEYSSSDSLTWLARHLKPSGQPFWLQRQAVWSAV